MKRRTFLISLAASAAVRERIAKTPDKRTGREVWQVTSGPAINHGCYFESQPFTEDDRFLVFCSNRSGAFQIHAVDLSTGDTGQLTNCAKLSTLSFSLHTDGRNVYYLDGVKLCRTDVSTGKTSVASDLAAEFKGASANATFAAGRCFSPDGKFSPASYSDGDKPGAMGLVNIETGRLERVIQVPGNSGSHMLICPADSNLVTFVRKPDEQNDMTLPMERRARTMIADLRTGKIRPYLTMPYGSRATHEYWAPDGKRFYFHRKTVPGWSPASICSMARDGSDWQTHFKSETLKLGHSIISESGRYIVSDVQQPKENPLLLIDLRSGKEEVLCWPNSSSGEAQLTHVHPAISRSGKYIAYTSDQSGTPQVYVVPLGDRLKL